MMWLQLPRWTLMSGSYKKIEVIWLVGDTRVSRMFFADDANVSMDPHGAVIQFTNGKDSRGLRLDTLMVRRLEQVTIRPA